MIASLRRLLAALFVACTLFAQSPQRPPNILFLFADDLQRAALGAFGGTNVHTPNLDALAAGGTALTNVYCMGSRHGAVCTPSRAMVMSGRLLPHVPDDLKGCTTLPELLREHGYATQMVGKWHNGDASLLRAFPDARTVLRGGMADHFHVPVCDVVAGKIENQRTGDRHSSELFADAAIAYLQERQHATDAKPFFAYIAFTAPHDPRDPPPEWLEKLRSLPRPELPKSFRGQHGLDLGSQTMAVRDENLLGWPRDPELLREQLTEYRALVAHLDDQIGRVLTTLRECGFADNTLIVFAADQGLALGSHGLLGKQSLYEHSMGTPAILSGPGIPCGARRAGLAYLLDLMPTMLTAAQVPVPDYVEGHDLGPLVRGESTGREEILLQYATTQRAIRNGDHKLIRLPEIDRTLLFDLHDDPAEVTNLAEDPAHAELRRELETRLRTAEHAIADALPWTADPVRAAELDMTGKRYPPDKWQPAWIVAKYFHKPDPDLLARVLPLTADSLFESPEWHHWGASVLQDADGTWHMFYARWPAKADPERQPNSFHDWLWTCEIAHAVAEHMAGPYHHVETVLQGRGANHWDQRNAHNPRLRHFGDHYYLYYIADELDLGLDCDRSNRGPNWLKVRNSQRTGVAIADSLAGPWRRLDAPLLSPGGPITNVAVNPTAVQRPDGSFLMLAKGDEPGSRAWRYGIALGPSPTGPFEWHKKAIDTGFSSEDPDAWYDAERQRYYALVTQTSGNKGRRYLSADGAVGVIRSDDGLSWTDAEHPTVLERTLHFADGTQQQFSRVERPSVILDRYGHVVGLTCAAHPRDGGNSKTIVIALAPERH
jgi:arylsulfatase A-like enzyme